MRDVPRRSSRQSKVPTGQCKVLTRQSKVLTRQSKVLTGQSKVLTGQSKVLTRQSKVMTRQSKVLTGQSKVLTGQSKVLTGQSKVLTRQSKVLTRQSKVLTRQSKVLTGQSKVLTSNLSRVDAFGPAEYERVYLATDDPRAQSGFGGSPERWTAARHAIVEGIDRGGTLLDIGCANGLLMESIAKWSPFPIEPYGVDYAPGLVELAKRRLPAWRDRIWVGDVATWAPSLKLDFVHVRLDIGHIERVAKWGHRLIVSSDGSFRRPESPKAANVAERLRSLGMTVAGEVYRRSEEHQVELSVAFASCP